MKDPWLHIVRAIEPEVDRLQAMLEKSIPIKPLLLQNKKGAWLITIARDQESAYQKYYLDDEIETFNNRIEWAVAELENWDAWRSSYDTWIFSSKEEAEKFITFYYLKWPH